MSVRAYRINKIDHEQGESFNLWHDGKLIEFFEGEGFFDSLSEGSGITELSVDVLQEAVARLKSGEIKIEDKEPAIKDLQKDIDWAIKKGDDYVQYYCY